MQITIDNYYLWKNRKMPVEEFCIAAFIADFIEGMVKAADGSRQMYYLANDMGNALIYYAGTELPDDIFINVIAKLYMPENAEYGTYSVKLEHLSKIKTIDIQRLDRGVKILWSHMADNKKYFKLAAGVT